MDSETSVEPHARRIRHISGVGIHELTLPGAATGVPAAIGGSPRARRTSHSSLDAPHGRARAPTLAGEGLHPPPHLPVHATVPEAGAEAAARPLARCFVSFTLPEAPETEEATSPPTTPVRSASRASGTPTGTLPKTRARTISLPPKPASSRYSSPVSSPSPSPSRASTPRLRTPLKSGGGTGNGSARGELARRPPRPTPVRRSTLGIARQSEAAPGSVFGPRLPSGPTPPSTPVPFFLAPIHEPSTHPRWASIEAGDLAPWLGPDERGSTHVDVAVWVEERGKWRRLPGVGGVLDLSNLVPVTHATKLPPNALTFTFANQPKSTYYYVSSDVAPISPTTPTATTREREKSVVERSLRETRMKKGASVGALHQLVNIQSVIADTQRSIEALQGQIDALIAADSDRTTVRRDIGERSLHVRWVRDRVAEVERTTEEARARITLHRGRLDARRALLNAAAERAEGTRSRVSELTSAIDDVESQRANILPSIYQLRARHAQDLDALFPITPIHAPSLLYSILDVPLPIPVGPKDPAPPLFLPPNLTPEGCPRIDERTTSAALGYAALLLQLIANLGGAAASLAYPVTYAGSKSHVRDVVSVMQGPRSFPLYGRGVERYRYEYAVFLLNKDIELLMYEADIRMPDLRHTLPNLKSLLAMLSSPEPPPPGPVTGPGWASGAASRASSRQPSANWAFNPHLRNMSLTSVGSSMGMGMGMQRSASMSTQTHSPSLGGASNASVGPTSESDLDTSHHQGFTTPAMGQGFASPKSGPTSPPRWVSPRTRSRLTKVTPRSDDERSDSGAGDGAESDSTEIEGYNVGRPAVTA